MSVSRWPGQLNGSIHSADRSPRKITEPASRLCFHFLKHAGLIHQWYRATHILIAPRTRDGFHTYGAMEIALSRSVKNAR